MDAEGKKYVLEDSPHGRLIPEDPESEEYETEEYESDEYESDETESEETESEETETEETETEEPKNFVNPSIVTVFANHH